MEYQCKGPGRRLIGVGVGIVALTYAVVGIRIWSAEIAARQPAALSLERAIRLQPGNAEYHFRLAGLYVEKDFNAAQREFKLATILNPHRARYWFGLARLQLYSAGVRPNGAGRDGAALGNALRAEPTNPQVIWEAANIYLASGDWQNAFAKFRFLAEHDPDLGARAILLCWRATHNVPFMLNSILPAQPYAYAVLMDRMMVEKNLPAAGELWARIRADGLELPRKQTMDYLDCLIAAREVDRAQEVWNFLLSHDASLQARTDSQNLIVNGGFESPIANGGFDWRYSATALAQMEVDTAQPHGGDRALRVRFADSHGSGTGLGQYVIVEPNTVYEFSSFVRTDDLYSPSGPQVAFEDASSHARIAATVPLMGSTGWRELRLTFQTGTQTRLMLLRLVREDLGGIHGTLWIDDMSLHKQ
jgi:hypothetical protein